MTPKQKAIELRDKMRLFCGTYLDADQEPKNNYKILKSEAKQCAIICVDNEIEALNRFASYWDTTNGEWYADELQKIEAVKTELLNL